ncbi:MAG: DHHA1 domain-containing protein [Chloroflexota bacterium]
MQTEQTYFDDPLKKEFIAEVTDTIPMPDGRIGVILPATYFYPTSGGQDHDIGTIGSALVVDVYCQADGRIVHIVDTFLQPGKYPAQIDWTRRLNHMQHHTAQHILSGSFEHVLELPSVSANINGDTPSTIDLDAPEPAWEDLRQVEKFANQIVFENRTVKAYFITDVDVPSVPFRRPPTISGQIRVIEVDGFDYSACGGTHCPSTAMVGLVLIVKTERVNHKSRIHFVAGMRALELIQTYQDTIRSAVGLLETNPAGLADAIRKNKENLLETSANYAAIRDKLLTFESDQMIASAKDVAGRKLITELFQFRSAEELRALGTKLSASPGIVAIIASCEAQKLSMVVACAPGTGLDARDILKVHLEAIHGRGGGDPILAQGGGVCDQSALSGLFEHTLDSIT